MTTNHKLDLDRLCTDLEVIAEMTEVQINQEVVQKILDAYGEHFEQGGVAFRTTNHPKGKRELCLRYLNANPHNPYAIALEHGLLTKVGHPIERLYADANERYPMICRGIDVGVTHGIEKIWPLFNVAVPVKDLFEIPSMPESVKSYADHFAKYDLKLFEGFAINYYQKSMNIYFLINRPGQYPPERCAEMIRDLGFTVPSDDELAINAKTGIIYHTFTWESPRCERLSFGVPHVPVPSDPYPGRLHPVFERLCNEMPVVAPQRKAAISTAYLADHSKDYLKIEVDYTGTFAAVLGAQIALIP